MEEIKHWITADLRIIEFNKMHKLHLIRTIKLIEGNGKQEFPDIWQGMTREKWLHILKNELKNRKKI